MPAGLHFSNSLEVLAGNLIRRLPTRDPLKAPIIAVPTPAMRGWLQLHLAERSGIAANLDFIPLEQLLWQSLAKRDRERQAQDHRPARLLDALNYQGLILARLRENPPAALRHYLQPAGSDAFDRARRLCQLSGRLAALFREYEYGRVGDATSKALTRAWMRGESCFLSTLDRKTQEERERAGELERWQMEIYQALFSRDGLRDRWGKATSVYRYTLPQYAELVLGQPEPPPLAPRTCHLFGLSHVSPFHRSLIVRLAEQAGQTFEIYALNPCREYWEDIRRNRGGRTKADMEEPGENGLLARFGTPGRDAIRLWCETTDYDFDGDFREAPGNSLLSILQSNVLGRRGPLPPDGKATQDPSLQIWSAPDMHAEAEAIRAHIAERLLVDPELRLEDIAVIPADFETYRPVLEEIFGGEGGAPGFVPHCFLEAGSRQNGFLRGFRLLLEFGAGPVRPLELLGWLEIPAVQRAVFPHGSGAKILAAWAELFELSGFREGWDAEHLVGRGLAPSASTWEAARERLLLHICMDPETPGLAGTDWDMGHAVVRDREDLAGLLDFMERLRRDLEPLRLPMARPFAIWSRWLLELVDHWFRPEADAPDGALETRGESELRKFCSDLESWSKWEPENAPGVAHPLITTLLEDHFRDPRSGGKPFLQGGVRIGGPTALRGLPFRHVYMPGLTAGEFPAASEVSAIDLRGFRPLPGESDPAARDLYGFLEILCSARERVTLSFLRRDPARDSVRQPSYALTALMAHVESDLLPRSSSQSEGFKILELDSQGRWESDADQAGWRDPPPRCDWHQIRLQASTQSGGGWGETGPAWARSPALPPTAIMTESSAVFDMWDLVEYLRDPARHAFFKLFRIPKKLGTEESEQSPPLRYDKFAAKDLQVPALGSELSAPGSGLDFLTQTLRAESRTGLGPPPPFSTFAEEDLGKKFRDLIKSKVPKLRLEMEKCGLRFAGTLRMGRSTRPLDPPVIAIPEFDFSPLGLPAALRGNLPLFLRGQRLENGWGAIVHGDKDWEWLRIYLFHLCLSAGAHGAALSPAPALIFECPFEDGAWKAYCLPRLTPGEATDGLRRLLEPALHAPDFDHLPLDVISKIAQDEKTWDLPDWGDRIESREREAEETAFSKPREKERIVRALDPEIPEDAGEKILRRLGPYFRWKKQREKIADQKDGEEA